MNKHRKLLKITKSYLKDVYKIHVEFFQMLEAKKEHYFSFIHYSYIRDSVTKQRVLQPGNFQLNIYMNFRRLNTSNKILSGVTHEVAHYLYPEATEKQHRQHWLQLFREIKNSLFTFPGK